MISTMIQETQEKKMEAVPCRLCSEMGIVRPVEVLPGGGVLFECAHDSGKLCEWAAYEGWGQLRNAKNDRMASPEIQECPKCHEPGVIKTERDDSTRPDRYSYRISHPDGRRCRLSGKDRDVILKLLGRYIPNKEGATTTVVQTTGNRKKKRKYTKDLPKITCPRCNDQASAAVYNGAMTCIHYVKNSGPIQHRMITPDEKRKFVNQAPSMVNTFRRQEARIESLERELAHYKRFYQAVNENVQKFPRDQELNT